MRIVALTGLLLAAACGEEPVASGGYDWDNDGDSDAGMPPFNDDASPPGAQPPPWSLPDTGITPPRDAGNFPPQRDAGSGAQDGGIEQPPSDGGPIPLDDASVPPPEGGGKWTLKAGSAPECPEEPPPIPLLGGLCLGVYWSCGWENELGQQYSCVCDWIHYLCLPL